MQTQRRRGHTRAKTEKGELQAFILTTNWYATVGIFNWNWDFYYPPAEQIRTNKLFVHRTIKPHNFYLGDITPGTLWLFYINCMYLMCRVNIHLYHRTIRLPFLSILSTFALFSLPYKHNLARIVHVMDLSFSTIAIVVIIFVDFAGVRVCNSPEKLLSVYVYGKINKFIRSNHFLSPILYGFCLSRLASLLDFQFILLSLQFSWKAEAVIVRVNLNTYFTRESIRLQMKIKCL